MLVVGTLKGLKKEKINLSEFIQDEDEDIDIEKHAQILENDSQIEVE